MATYATTKILKKAQPTVRISDNIVKSWDIEVSIKDGKEEILAARVDISPAAWIYLDYENGDLIINHSPKMTGNRWNHIIRETLDNIDE